MNDIEEEHITFPVEEVTCEGMLAYPSAAAPVSAVLFLAPHPLLGGNIDNNVIRHLWRRFAEDGAAALRFNYRGVGGSGLNAPEGMSAYAWFSQIESERRYDVFLPECRGALEFLRKATPGTPVIVVGYSLGAVLAAMLAPVVPITALIAISPPNARISIEAFEECAMRKLFIAGGRDSFFDSTAFSAALDRFPLPKTLKTFPASDHFYRGEEEALYQTIQAWLADDEVQA
jgi:alpha/beta superfamily hydrolase